MILSVAFSIVINIPSVQDRLTKEGFSKLEEMFGNKLSFTDVKLRLFSRVQFEELLILDQQNDTLIYAKKFDGKLPGIMRKLIVDPTTPVRISKLHMNEAYIRLYNDSTSVINLKFIPDTVKAKRNPEKEPEPLFIDKVIIENSRVEITQHEAGLKEEGINLKNLVFNNFNLKVSDLKALADTVNLEVDYLSFIEQSGFHVTELNSKLHITNKRMYFSEISIKSPYSDLKFDYVKYDFNDFVDFSQGGLLDKVNIRINCISSTLNSLDISYFAPVFKGMDNELKMSGKFYGKIANLNARQFDLSYGENTHLSGQFDIIGLPDSKNTFLIFDSKKFVTTSGDMLNFQLPKNKRINLPDAFNSITDITYKGNFTGFFQDFVSYGTFQTNMGNGTLDILFRPDTLNTVSFAGELVTEKFNVGELAGLPDVMGNAKLDLKIDGYGTVDEGFSVDLSGAINDFEINQYTYNAINVDGNFAQKKFNGKLSVDDPNLKMNFDGLFDLSSEIWTYNFTANVLNANLYTLNINKKDPNYAASFLLKANLTGNSIDSINGDVKLLNSLFAKTDAQIQVYDLGIEIKNDSLSNSLSIHSDFLDGEIKGHYLLSQLHSEYLHLLNNYLPSLHLLKTNTELLSSSDFSYSINFKNSYPLFEFFLPEYSLSPRTYVSGRLQRSEFQSAEFHLESPEILFNKSELTDVTINSQGDSKALNIDFGCKEFDLSKRITLENFTLLSTLDSNTIDFSTRWINWDSTLNKGNFGGNIALLNDPGKHISANVRIDTSVLVIEDSLWTVAPFTVNYDSSFLYVDNFNIVHNNEFVKINGELSNSGSDSLVFDFNDFNFSNLNYLTRSKTFRFGGILNGNAKMRGIQRPLFLSSISIKNLELNNELIGDTYVESKWNNDKESIQINSDVFRGQLRTLSIVGDIYPSRNSEINLVMNFDKFRLGFINPYLNTVFSDIQGLATGLVSLTGIPKEPKLNGNINLQKAALTVDYLQTRYNFTSEVAITNNNIVFDQAKLYDKNLNSAMLNGIIKTEYLKNFSLNLSLQPQNFLCLDTDIDDNQAFYGEAYTTGLVRIQGPTSSLKFNISATTEPGTRFSIPLSGSEELSEFGFIKMISSDTMKVEVEEEEYKANISGMQLDFDLNVTPDAEVKIIFDPTLGDEITARGHGDLRIAINSLGDFRMLGDYVIEDGDYLFTMKDILFNRKFKVLQGSNLSWTGDPVNADVNINTYYRTKARIGDLVLEDSASTYRHSVDCKLGISGKLKEPEITYGIELPFAEQSEKDKLSAAILSDEELGKQFLSLLVLSKFLPRNQENSGFQNSGIAEVNASELLSNQLSNWLSQISDEFDIGVNYRPGTELSSQELELALSTQLLNDRLSINGSIDMKTNAEAEQARNIPNLDLDYKITRNGKIRARAYNRATDNQIADIADYTQGIGVFYTEEFDKFSEIGENYRNKRKSRKKNKTAKTIEAEGVNREEETTKEE